MFPSQLENVIDAHEKVSMSCVIGIPDPIKQQRIKAFITLKPGIEPTQQVKDEVMEHVRKWVAKYSLPSEIEFREDLPKTLVGKVAYRVLEEEELAKMS